jgi:hypothetical protein
MFAIPETTVTDADGRYRLTGLPRGLQIEVRFGLGGHADLLPQSGTLPATADDAEKTVNVEMKRGILVTGRVVDPLTRNGVLSTVGYAPVQGNEHAKASGYNGPTGYSMHGVIEADGKFQIAVIPGPGALLVDAYDVMIDIGGQQHSIFRRGHVTKEDEAKLKVAVQSDGLRSFATPSRTIPLRMMSAVKYIDVAADSGPHVVDVELDRGKAIELNFVDADGQPVTGAAIVGILEAELPTRMAGSQATVYGLDGESPRKVFVLHRERGLAGSLTLTGEEASPVRMTLGKSASIHGRAVDNFADPIASSELHVVTDTPGRLRVFENASQPRLMTDKDGRFQVGDIIPGERIRLSIPVDGKVLSTLNAKLIEGEQSPKPGEDVDLGDVVFAPLNQQARPQNEPANPAATKPPLDPPANGGKKDAPPGSAAKPKDGSPVAKGAAVSGPAKATVASTEYSVLSTQFPAQNNSASGKSQSSKISGTILNPDGKPSAKAFVAVVGSRIRSERGGDLSSRSDVLAETTTDDRGHFEIQLTDVSAKSYSQTHAIARSDDSGIAWRRIDPDERDVDLSLELPADQIIRGRFIDLEGRPAGGIQLSVNSVGPRATTGTRAERIGHYEFAKVPRAWPPSVTVSQDGSFAIRGIPADHGVHLAIEGNDRFASQSVTLNTGAPEQRPESDATYRSLVRNVKPGEEAVLPLAPAQIFEGVVRFADTREPAPHARLTVFSSQQENIGSWYGLAGKADAQGRYRINPHPGVRFGITAYPPDGVPYLTRKIREITHKDGALLKQVDVTLPRGVLVRGRVVESGTKTPIAGAMIQYVPETRNNRNVDDDIITGWQGIQLSETDGAFEIAVLPGPGTLLANGPNGEFVLQEFGSRQLERGAPGGDRSYAHAMQHINPEPNSDPLNPTLEMRRGATLSVRLTNAAHEPVEHALVISRLFVNPSELNWRGFPKEALGGRFELSGLADGVEYTVHFLDAKNRLGATAVFKGSDKSASVELTPCGEASATITDAGGKPVAGYFPRLDIIVAPGPDRFEAAAKAPGVFAGDAAYVVNIDRTNYQKAAPSDDQGRITYPALVPGARYRIITYEKGIAINLKEFVAESGKTLELGKIAYVATKEE